MKIEFIKQTNPKDGFIVYLTKVNDRFVCDSLSAKEDEARKWFELIKKNGPDALEHKLEVIESIEIEYEKK
jgi:hypothetical protein